MNVHNQIQELEQKLSNLKQQMRELRSRKKFLCGCGTMHMIKDCEVVQTHWYVRPYGCSGGDYYNEGELQIVCPAAQIRNRILFEHSGVPYDKRGMYDYDSEEKFKCEYKSLFKNVKKEYDEHKNYNSVNNYYFDKNRKKFNIEV